MTRMVAIDADTFVAGQIDADDLAAAREAGVTLVVNNRPDHEEPDQPTSGEIARAAEAAGLGYRHIPVAGGISPAQVEAMADALEESAGKTLAFCRSGTRSAYLWAMARASRGADPERLIVRAAEAGYDLGPLAPHLRR